MKKIYSLLFSALAVTSINAQVPTLDIVEHSSTSLTATYAGSSLAVTLNSPDHWTIAGPPGVEGTFGQIAWIETGATTGFNLVDSGDPNNPSASGITVVSDINLIPISATQELDGVTIVELFLGGTVPGAIAVTFTDLGDTPSNVPDVQWTLWLLMAACAPIAAARSVQASDGARCRV